MGMIKTRKEISFLKKAAKIANSCIPIIEKSLREEITERELARRIGRKIYSQGGRLSFRTLVGSGPRSAMIHTKPPASDRVVSGIGYIDFGASWRGYKTDMTVPFVKGKAKPRERRIVRTVMRAYGLAVRKWRPGMRCWRIHDHVDNYMRARGFAMMHAVGHGVGRKIHERPLIVRPRKKLSGRKLRRWEKMEKIAFEPGMAFTIEPGIYVKGVGGSRIENTFLVVGKSLKSLTKARLIEV